MKKNIVSVIMYSLLNLILVQAFVWNRASLHCIDILDQYYSCRHLHPINLVKNPPFGPADWYVFNGSLDDGFFKRELADTSIEAALDLFRQIAVENNASCTSLTCNCTRSNTIDLGKVYNFYFANATYFPQVRAIIANATRNSTLLTPLQIYSRTGQFYALFDATIYAELPTLAHYCLANDFTFNRVYNYNETYECYANAYVKASTSSGSRSSGSGADIDNLFECEWAYMMFDAATGKLDAFNKTRANFSTLESYYSCRLAPVVGVPSCNVNIQRFIALNYIDPKIVRGNLSDYLDGLLKKSNTSRPLARFNITRIYANLGASPLKNLTQICPIRNTPISCLRTPALIIECAGDERSQAAWANLTFVLTSTTNQTYSYSLFVNFTSMPRYVRSMTMTTTTTTILTTNPTNSGSNQSVVSLSSPSPPTNDARSSVVMMPPNYSSGSGGSGSKWLETVTDGVSMTYLVDYNTNTTFVFEDKFSMTIYAPDALFRNATGLLVSGCAGNTDVLSIGG